MSLEPRALDLLAALAEPEDRVRVAVELARRLGSLALFVFVPDRELGGTLVPAPGFAKGVPGGSGWRELLRACSAQTGHVQHGDVAYPDRAQSAPALALVWPGLVFVFVGGAPDAGHPVLATATRIAPLLGALFAAESSAASAVGNLQISREAAQQAASLATALDRTRAELERQAESLRAAGARAEQAARVKDEFLAMLGHELRNPLSPIVTALHLLRRKGASYRELDIIGRHVEQLTRLVDDLLDVARITQGKIELRNERVSLGSVARQAVEMASPLFERKQQQLVMDGPLDALHVDADPARLAQVISNLLTNASRYSLPRTCVVVSARRDGERVRFSVKDQGRGLDPAMLEAIFDTFMQAKQSADRTIGGLGLGLAIVRSLVTMLGGRVWAESAGVGRGSEFIVELPRVEPAVTTCEPALPAAVSPTFERGRLLVVDDNEDAAELLSESLRRAGHDVATAHDANQALELARTCHPEVALLDIGLPVMDGYELAEQLLAVYTGTDLQMVAITGYGQSADKERARAAGFRAHFVKPVPINELLQAVQSLLAAQRRR
jgi:signal transduction histidine kinase/CheY-like chemotaxis protein